MRSSPSIRTRFALLVGAIAASLGGGALVAPQVGAATPRYPLGLERSPVSAVAPRLVPEQAPTYAAVPPASVDLTQWAVPVGNQGQVGSCVSWTVGYTISGWFARRDGRAGQPYAPLYLYNQLTNYAGGATVGTSFYGNLSLEQSGGIPPKADFGGTDYLTSYRPTTTERATAANYKIADWATLYYSQSQSAASGQALIKQALADEKPVALGIKVYSNFYSVSSANSGRYDAIGGSFLGRHAVAVLGYDSFGVRIQNSWGTGWGDGGFAWLSWNFLATQSEEAYVVNGFTAPAAGTAPVISSLSATSGPWSGGSITITGTDLTGASVMFGTKPSPSVTVNSDTSVTAQVPVATAGAVDVRVSTPTGGRSNALSYTYGTAAPTITSITPSSGAAAGGTTITVAGTNLAQLSGSAYTVTVGGRPATNVTVAADGASFTAVTPSGAIGAANVVVTNAGGTSAAGTYTYNWTVEPTLTLSTPKLTTIKPGKLALTGTIKLPSGTAVAKTAVSLQSRPKGTSGAYTTVATATSNPSGKIAFSLAATSSSEFRLSAAGGITSASLVVTVQPPPTVSSMSSTLGTTSGGQTVIVQGANFGGAKVTVGGTPASSVTVADDGASLTFVAPARSPGKAKVVVVTATGKVTAGSYVIPKV